MVFEEEETSSRKEQTAKSGSVDLLRSVRTNVAVSSAYRDKQAQIVSLLDGNLQTAWNSRTDDLVGAWIEVRLPDTAQVTSIALTVGFTQRPWVDNRGKRRDLFTENHRISKVRVRRASQELGVFELDTDSRALQTLPVKGAGGVYRIEVLEVTPGTKSQWREICVSELRVMGRASAMDEGLRFPRYAIGALPAPRARPGTVDRDKVRRDLRKLIPWLTAQWGAVIDGQMDLNYSTGRAEEDRVTIAPLVRKRRQVIGRVAKLVDSVDEVQGDRLRFASLRRDELGESSWQVHRRDDQELLTEGLDSVIDWLGEEDLRCRWAKNDSKLRLALVTSRLVYIKTQCEAAGPQDDPDWERQCQSSYGAMERVERVKQLWEQNPRQALARIVAVNLMGNREGSFLHQKMWSALKTRAEQARKSCGWDAR